MLISEKKTYERTLFDTWNRLLKEKYNKIVELEREILELRKELMK